MSAFTTMRTEFVSQEHLIKALADMGFTQVESHDTPQPLQGWMGDNRAQRSEVIIRKQFISNVSNDIGFRRKEDGKFEALISEYDSPTYNAGWLGQLAQRYAYHVSRDMLMAQDFEMVEEEMQEDNTIRLTLRRMS